MPAEADVSFIDAAHLLPLDRFHNDHPTNGLALCKNHHWAMDRQITMSRRSPNPSRRIDKKVEGRRRIAPAPDHRWQASTVVDARRSNGEKELSELSGRKLLLPKDPAFHPDAKGLEWRVRKLGG